jgi:beta-glucanase (GH16 family)
MRHRRLHINMFYQVCSIPSLVFIISLPNVVGLHNSLRSVAVRQRLAAEGSANSFCSAVGWNHEWGDDFDGDHLGESWSPITSEGEQGDHSAPVSGLGVTACRSAKCRPENVRVEDGHLMLLTDRDPEDPGKYHTGAVTTRGLKNWQDDQPYRMCISAKLPGGGENGGGVWPAHWMLPDNGLSEQCLDEGEVDIMEMINGDGGAYSTYHYMTSWPNMTCGDFNKYHKSRNTLTHVPHFHDQFHEFAIERSKDHISYAIDGRVVHHMPSDQLKIPLSHSPFFLILNTAVGGAWPGEPTSETSMPTEHMIDYVRVARKAEDQPDLSSLSAGSAGLPVGTSADDIADVANSASWADAWRPSSFMQTAASHGPPPPMSIAF